MKATLPPDWLFLNTGTDQNERALLSLVDEMGLYAMLLPLVGHLDCMENQTPDLMRVRELLSAAAAVFEETMADGGEVVVDPTKKE